VITLTLTDREAAILYLKFDMLTNGNNANKVLNAVFEKLEQGLLARQSQDCTKKEVRFNILDELQLSMPAKHKKQ